MSVAYTTTKDKEIQLVSDGYTVAVKSVDEAMSARAEVIQKLFEVVALGVKKTQAKDKERASQRAGTPHPAR